MSEQFKKCLEVFALLLMEMSIVVAIKYLGDLPDYAIIPLGAVAVFLGKEIVQRIKGEK